MSETIETPRQIFEWRFGRSGTTKDARVHISASAPNVAKGELAKLEVPVVNGPRDLNSGGTTGITVEIEESVTHTTLVA